MLLDDVLYSIVVCIYIIKFSLIDYLSLSSSFLLVNYIYNLLDFINYIRFDRIFSQVISRRCLTIPNCY